MIKRKVIRSRAKHRKPFEMSKILLIVSDVIMSVTVIGTFFAVFYMSDTSPLAYLIPGVFGLSSVAHGFYFWKAKAENLQKFGQEEKITMSGNDDPGCDIQ